MDMLPARDVLGDKEDPEILSHDFVGGKSGDDVRAFGPAGDGALGVEEDDAVLAVAYGEQVQHEVDVGLQPGAVGGTVQSHGVALTGVHDHCLRKDDARRRRSR